MLWHLMFDLLTSKTEAYIRLPKCINAENFVKFRPKSAFPACWTTLWPWLWPFEPKTCSVHSCPKTHQCWKFGRNTSNTFQDITLTTFGKHAQMHRQTHKEAKYIMLPATKPPADHLKITKYQTQNLLLVFCCSQQQVSDSHHLAGDSRRRRTAATAARHP